MLLSHTVWIVSSHEISFSISYLSVAYLLETKRISVQRTGYFNKVIEVSSDIILSLITLTCPFCSQNKHSSRRFILLQSYVAGPWFNLFSAAPRIRPTNRQWCAMSHVLCRTFDAHRKMKIINAHAKRKLTFSVTAYEKTI